MNTDHFLFVEKYRPKTISECILPERLKNTFLEMIQKGEIQNLLLSGGPGCGKTTVARALCNELKSDYILINCSEDGNIDTLRTKIKNFASTVSFGGNTKIIILDEFDYSNPQSMQPALRGFMEEFSKNCRFILTCNYKNRVISPLHSRCTVIDFKFEKNETTEYCTQFYDRCVHILNEEGIGFSTKALAKFVFKHFPDFRRTLNELQKSSLSGEINESILVNMNDEKIHALVKMMKKKDFTGVRSWVTENADNDTVVIFRKFFDNISEYFEKSSVPMAILILGDYQYKAAFVADHEINISACLVNLMLECSFNP
jgi:DNA polymerase III delta prime subunit